MKALLTITIIFCMYNLQAQDITIKDSTNYTIQTVMIEFIDDCVPYFESGTTGNNMYIKGYSDTKEHFYILIDCNGYIIKVNGLKHKTELNK